MPQKINTIEDFITNSTEIQDRTEYTVLDQNETEFIISRKKGGKERMLAVLPQHNMFYIQERNMKQTLSKANLRRFLSDLNDELELKAVNWLPSLTVDSIDEILALTQKPFLAKICACGIAPQAAESYEINHLWHEKPELLKAICRKIEYTNRNSRLISILAEIEARFGWDSAIYFIENLNSAESTKLVKCSYSFTRFLDETEKLNAGLISKELLEYLLFGLYAQGFNQISNDLLSLYQNVLELQKQLYGRMADPFPVSLLTKYQELILEHRKQNRQQMEEAYQKARPRLREMAYATEGYTIRPILTYDDLLKKLNQTGCPYDSVLNDPQKFGFELQKGRNPSKIFVADLKGNVYSITKPASKKEMDLLTEWSNKAAARHLKAA